MAEYFHLDFKWPVLIWPIALLVFVAFFFRYYVKDTRLRLDAEDRIDNKLTKAQKRKQTGSPEHSRLPLQGLPGHMTKRDCLLALALTVAYGVLAFSFTGSTTAPQTFWRATREQPSLTIDLDQDIRLCDIMYYTGRGDGYWSLELSTDGKDWSAMQRMTQSMDDCELFNWMNLRLIVDSKRPIQYLRLTASKAEMELGELVFVILDENGQRVLFNTLSLSVRYPQYFALFDEQHLIPDLLDLGKSRGYDPNYGRMFDHNYGMYFDEVDQATTAYEYIHNLTPYENTHPPLGKSFIALGIQTFGMTPFGWRFMGISFGVLMVPLIYVLIINLLGNTKVAICGTALFAFENMHFAHTHIATVDAYVVLFIICMYLFMFRYISKEYDTPFKKTLPTLLLCGLSFGLSVAVKWTGLYAALGLLVLYAVHLVKRGKHQIAAGQLKEFRSFLCRTLIASTVFFVVIPFTIYTLSYIPYTTANGQPFTINGLVSDMWNRQAHMLTYHAVEMTDANHADQSSWWMWMLGIQPKVYLRYYREGGRTIIAAFTNPLVTIGGLVAMCVAAFDFYHRRVKEAFFIVVGYLVQLAPWILVSRPTFAYHYFPSVIFLTLAICYVFNHIFKYCPEHKRWVYSFTGVSAGLFFLLLPPTAGILTPDWYTVWFTRWLPSWPFW